MKKRMLALLLAAGMAVCLTGCEKGSGSETGGAPASEAPAAETQTKGEEKSSKDTLNVGIDSDSGTLAPVHNSKLPGWVIYETLYLFNNKTQDYEMMMAESIDFTDSQHMTLKLHDGITDSAGNHFTSSDVLFCMKNALNDTVTSMYVPYIDFEASHVIDDLTLEIVLTETNVMQWILLSELRMYCQKAMEDSPDGMINNPVGTGPYVLTEYINGSSIKMERREDYWGEQPSIKYLNWLVIPESSQRAIALESGEIDLCMSTSAADFQRFKEDSAYGTYIRNTYKNAILEFNCSEDSVFHDAKARQAAAYAVDANAIVQNVYNGLSNVSNGATANGLVGSDPEWNADYYGYNVDKAKELMAEAGIAEGTKIVIGNNGSTETATIAEIVQSFLNSAGFDAQIVNYDSATWLSVRTDSNCGIDISVHYYSSPDGYYAGQIWSGVFTAGTNHYENDELYDLVMESMATVDSQKQLEINKKINDIMVSEVPGYGLAAKVSLYAWNSELKGVEEMIAKRERLIPGMLSFQ